LRTQSRLEALTMHGPATTCLTSRDTAIWLRRASLMLLLANGRAYAQGPAPPHDAFVAQALSAAQNLPPADDSDIDTVVVRPDAFAESDRKLAKIRSGLPGADDAVDVKLDVVDRVGRYFDGRRDPNALSDDSKQTMLKSFEPRNNNP
jgi:hypothetical protein